KHSGIAFLTPADAHYGRGEARLAARHAVTARSLCRTPGTLPARPAEAPSDSGRDVHQPADIGGRSSVNVRRRCLKLVDRLRSVVHLTFKFPFGCYIPSNASRTQLDCRPQM